MPNIEDIKVKSSLSEMEKSLGTIASDTSKIKSFFETNVEEQVEGKRAEKLKGKEEKTQTKLLQGIFKNTKDGKGKGESFLSRHWGKLLLALLAAIAALKVPWKMFNSPSDFADEILNQIDKHPYIAGAVAAGGALKARSMIKNRQRNKFIDKAMKNEAAVNKKAQTEATKTSNEAAKKQASTLRERANEFAKQQAARTKGVPGAQGKKWPTAVKLSDLTLAKTPLGTDVTGRKFGQAPHGATPKVVVNPMTGEVLRVDPSKVAPKSGVEGVPKHGGPRAVLRNANVLSGTGKPNTGGTALFKQDPITTAKNIQRKVNLGTSILEQTQNKTAAKSKTMARKPGGTAFGRANAILAAAIVGNTVAEQFGVGLNPDAVPRLRRNPETDKMELYTPRPAADIFSSGYNDPNKSAPRKVMEGLGTAAYDLSPPVMAARIYEDNYYGKKATGVRVRKQIDETKLAGGSTVNIYKDGKLDKQVWHPGRGEGVMGTRVPTAGQVGTAIKKAVISIPSAVKAGWENLTGWIGGMATEEGRHMKKVHEGRVYDVRGIPHIGIGHNLHSGASDKTLKAAGIRYNTKELLEGKDRHGNPVDAIKVWQLNKLYREDIKLAQQDAIKFVGSKEKFLSLTPQAQGVLTNMAFNMGGPSLNKFSKLRAALTKEGGPDYETASHEMLYNSDDTSVKTSYHMGVPKRATAQSGIMSAQSQNPNVTGNTLVALREARLGLETGAGGNFGVVVNEGPKTIVESHNIIPSTNGAQNPKDPINKLITQAGSHSLTQ